jgi:hypothetical protein
VAAIHLEATLRANSGMEPPKVKKVMGLTATLHGRSGAIRDRAGDTSTQEVGTQPEPSQGSREG